MDPKLLKIILFIKLISPKTILKNHEMIKDVIGQNVDWSDYQACGVSSQALFNILLKKHNIPITHASYLKNDKINIESMLNSNCIMLVRLDGFPSHAFVIYNIHNKSIILQSYIGCYDHRKHIDILSRNEMRYYLETLKNMYTDDNKITGEMIAVLNILTHVKHIIIPEGINNLEKSFTIFYVPLLESRL